MKTWIALLRGIGLGRNKLLTKELVQILGSLRLEDVKTYIQTGNAVFRTRGGRPARLAEQITDAVAAANGFAPLTIVLTVDELRAAVADNPFAEAEALPQTLHLTFLASAPRKPDLEALERVRKSNERFELRGSVFYLHAPDGIGRSKLAERIEKALGVQGTARNWRSVTKILELAEEIDA